MDWVAVLSFFAFTGLVGALTWWITHKDDHASTTGYFLAGRSLTFPLIAGSLLLTNLSTEQMIGLNGAAFSDGLAVMVWEVVAVLGLVAMALFFLPRFLKSGVSTVPQYLALRFDEQTQLITNIIFLVAYVGILLPIILYTGATGLAGMLNVQEMLGLASHTLTLWLIVILVGVAGSIYALFGGLRTVAVSDTLNGAGLLVGGFLITGFGLHALSDGQGVTAGFAVLRDLPDEYFNSIGSQETSVPFTTIFSGILLLNLFYWTTNQQIIQRTFGASSLAEGQKGVLLTGFLKLLGPLYLVLPGIIAYAMFADSDVRPDHAYGMLVNTVLPKPLAGFFAAVLAGAILSSFNSALNSSCTMFSLGVYKGVFRPEAGELEVVRSGKIFGWIVAIAAMTIAPFLAQTASIFAYLQKMNGMYFIPIFAVVLVGMLTRRVPPLAAKVALLTGFVIIAMGYFVPPFNSIVAAMHEFHFLGLVFAYLVVLMLIIGELRPRTEEWTQEDVQAVDMRPWPYARYAGAALVVAVVLIYLVFADFSVLG